MQKSHGLLAVRYIANLALMPAPGQRLTRQTDVGRVVIHEKDLRQFFHRSGSPLLNVTTGRQRELDSGVESSLSLATTLSPRLQ
jgi:hypothetical protein